MPIKMHVWIAAAAIAMVGTSAVAQSAPMNADTAKQSSAMSVSGTNKRGDAASAAPKKRTAQQEKMARCNKDATGKKGDERKAFMKQCLKAA